MVVESYMVLFLRKIRGMLNSCFYISFQGLVDLQWFCLKVDRFWFKELQGWDWGYR